VKSHSVCKEIFPSALVVVVFLLASGCAKPTKPVPVRKIEIVPALEPLLFLKQNEIPNVRHALAKEHRHKVLEGDTLYGIAWRYDLDPEQLARWNKIENPDLILRAKTLRLTPPHTGSLKNLGPISDVNRVGSRPAQWVHPHTASSGRNRQLIGKSVRYHGRFGDAVIAAADGLVVYSGSNLKAYGELIIIKHDDEIMSAYAHNSRRLVVEGDRVEIGAEIALMGESASGETLLHFEIRVRGRPADPSNYLPAL
jgi:lipoprotein NlpD